MAASEKSYKRIYDVFTAPISQTYDCGKFCAPLNNGSPVCCSTQHAVPIVTKAEWSVLKPRTEIWSKFKPYDAATRQIVKELPTDCKAVQCKGARFCERDNRTLACRAFPFFPYITKDREIIGVSVYWTFEDRCWVISNLQIADEQFVEQLLSAYEELFAQDQDEFDAFFAQSASMRRVFTRRNQIIPVLARKGECFKVLPRSGGKVKPARLSEFKPADPFSSMAAYRRAVREWGGTLNGVKLPKRSP